VADRGQPSPGEWAILAGGVVALVGSFLDFAGDTSAWGSGPFPIVTLIPIYCVVMAVQIALTRFASTALPERVAGFTWEQVHLVLGFFAALMALFWLVAADDTGGGLWLILLGAAACLAGAVMLQRERATGAIG
jgi:hypothetical protein